MVDSQELIVFSGSSNPELALKVCSYLDISIAKLTLNKFIDGEIHVKSEENVRGKEVFIIQSTNPPAENIIELLIMIDALKRASAETITVIIPYYGYARQDRKTKAREPITAKLLANIITVAGANRVISIDLHAGQIQGFFDIPSDNLTASLFFSQYIKSLGLENIIVASPDIGGVNRAKQFANILGVGIAICSKNREEKDKVESIQLIGDVEGKIAVLIDDIISTGETLTKSAAELKAHGAVKILACATHGIFVGNSLQLINDAPIDEVIVTDTVSIEKEKLDKCHKIHILSIFPLIGEAILRVKNRKSLSELFYEFQRISLF
jgi:ribose-phosphate pyrophosphokinase